MTAPTADLDELLALATTLACDAGRLLLDRLSWSRVSVETKSSRTDMVTEVDRASEQLIVGGLAHARPGDAVLGEEGTVEAGSTGVRWVVDPLDGTTNYLYGFPAFAVSIAAEVAGVIAVGVVHDPTHAETWAAVRGRGATCNGEPVRVGTATELVTCLVGTGFSYLPERRAWQAAVAGYLLPRVRDIRRAGAASLDLCWLAGGRLDAFYERGLAPWDWAAGSLVAAEAGATVGPAPDELVVATAPHLAGGFARLLADAEAEATAALGPLPPL